LRRFLLIVALILAALAVLPAPASASGRMFVGFQDDPSFRWAGDRAVSLDAAARANATVVRATVEWADVAPRRPASPGNPFDPAYRFENVDELVRNAQQRGIETMLTVWGTPRWANAGRGKNRLPSRLADLTAFSRALAARYSGRYQGFPHVRFYSVWNEPNREQFLAPQFDSRGRSAAPALYARLYRAAYAGLKGGNSTAQVAIGETAPNGRDRRTARRGLQQTHSPGRFAQLVARQRPRVRFDAWAHHPYPTSSRVRPIQTYRWPNVGLTSLGRFGTAIDGWYGRKGTKIWITEYAHETGSRGVALSTQAAYASQALTLARRNARVQMFVWFVLRDRPETPWRSGLLTATGAAKPAFARFAAAARGVDARAPMVTSGVRDPFVRLSALPIAYYSPTGSRIGVTYRVYSAGRLVAAGMPAATLARDGWFGVRLGFRPLLGRNYVVEVDAEDVNGNRLSRTVTVAGARLGVKTTLLPAT
jgi:hypothetical protein